MKKIRYYFFMILGIALLLDFIVLQIYLTSFNAGLVFPGILGIISIFYSYYRLKKDINIFDKIRKYRKAINTIIILFIVSFIIIEVIIISSAHNYSKEKPKYMIVLGAGLKNNQLSLTLKKRVETAVIYLKENPNSIVVVSGGKGFDETITESSAMKKYIVDNGIKENRVLEENKSSSTVENIRFSKKILSENGWDKTESIVLITNEFHMMRARLIAKRVGIKTVPLPAATPYSVIMNNFVREYFAVIKTYIFDR